MAGGNAISRFPHPHPNTDRLTLSCSPFARSCHESHSCSQGRFFRNSFCWQRGESTIHIWREMYFKTLFCFCKFMEPSLLGALMVQAFPSPLVDVICESSQRGLIKVGIAVVIANLERGVAPGLCILLLALYSPSNLSFARLVLNSWNIMLDIGVSKKT